VIDFLAFKNDMQHKCKDILKEHASWSCCKLISRLIIILIIIFVYKLKLSTGSSKQRRRPQLLWFTCLLNPPSPFIIVNSRNPILILVFFVCVTVD